MSSNLVSKLPQGIKVFASKAELPQAAVHKSDAEWMQLLGAEKFKVCRKEGTECAFTGKFYKWQEAGVFNCACCAKPLFSTTAKFESGTGWVR